jgi:hypothetical protein
VRSGASDLRGENALHMSDPRTVVGLVSLERIGANGAGAEHLDDVTVVFTATRPGGGRVVVSW